MILEQKVVLTGGTYKASVSLVELTATEKEKLAQFAEPLVQCGGEISQGEITFTLPADTRRFPSQFPITKGWAFGAEDAGEEAKAWAQVIEARIVAAVSELIAIDPGPVGRTQTTYNIA